MEHLSIASVHLQVREPVSGVTLEAYVKCEGSQAGIINWDEEEAGSSLEEANLAVRCRWFRACDKDEHGRPTACHFHPDRPAAFHCGFWRTELTPYGYMYAHACHCSLECFSDHFQVQRTYWERAQNAKRQSADGNCESIGGKSMKGSGDSGWLVVGRSKRYTPTELDIGHRLRLRVSVVDLGNDRELHDSHRFLLTEPVRRAPEPVARRMVPITVPRQGNNTLRSKFTVLSYNILAELYATQQAFPTSDPCTLLWQYRRQLILRELAIYDADIVCLQEVQSTSFHEDLQPEMDRRGFDAVFKKKTQEDILMTGGRYAMDGCATFYRRDRFSLVKKYEVEFNKAAQSYVEGIMDQQDRRKNEHRLMKPNVALILVLEGAEQLPADSGTRSLVCVANTHIHANQDLPDVKLWQVHTLLKGLEKIANSANIPMIVAGDLNSVPGSAPHVLMMQQHVEVGHRDLEKDPLSLFTGHNCGSKLSHTLRLQSAYAAAMHCGIQSPSIDSLRSRIDEVHQEPMHTNITNDFKAALDYICCSSPELQITALLDLPDLQAMLKGDLSSGLPNAYWPSDHIALMAEVQFAAQTSRS